MMTDEASRNSDDEQVLAVLRFGIAKRLIHVCTHMASHDFDAMVASMARIQHKYEVLGSRSFAKAVAR